MKWNRGIGEFLSLSQLSFLFGGINSVQEKDIESHRCLPLERERRKKTRSLL